MARDEQNPRSRDKYRDDDDVPDPMPPPERNETRPDTRDEVRGDAREKISNTVRGTDTNVTGPENNDRTKRQRPDWDEYQADLDRKVE